MLPSISSHGFASTTPIPSTLSTPASPSAESKHGHRRTPSNTANANTINANTTMNTNAMSTSIGSNTKDAHAKDVSAEWQSLMCELQIGDESHTVSDYASKTDPRLKSMEYLEKNQMHFYLSDVLQQLAIYRPTNASTFLAEYFSKVAQGKQCLRREYAFVRRTDRNRAAFVEMVSQAGKSLADREVSKEDCHEFVMLLCPDFPKQPIEDAYRVIMSGIVRDRSPNFREFVGALRLTFVYGDYMRLCANLFDILRDGTNHVDKQRFCIAIDQQVSAGFDITSPTVAEIFDARKRVIKNYELGDITLWDYFTQLMASLDASRISAQNFASNMPGAERSLGE